MTNAWGDVANTKLLMVLGSNFVENHPGVAQYANIAVDNGAKFVAVDPRRTRTVSWGLQRVRTASDALHVRLRPGTNTAMTCGLINYMITNTDMSGATGTAATLSGTTLTDGAATFGSLVGSYLRVTTAGHSPDWRKITSNTGTSVTFTPAFSTSGTVDYEICKSPLVDSAYAYNYTDGPYRLSGSVTATGAVDYARSMATGDVPLFNDSGTNVAGLTAYGDKFSPKKTWTNLNDTTGGTSVFVALKNRMAQYTPQIVADVAGVPVHCPNEPDLSALGAAMLARGLTEPGQDSKAIAAAMTPSARSFAPGSDAPLYADLFARYLRSLPAASP